MVVCAPRPFAAPAGAACRPGPGAGVSARAGINGPNSVYKPERVFKVPKPPEEAIKINFNDSKLDVEEIKQKMTVEEIDDQVWEMKRQLAMVRLRRGNFENEPYRGEDARWIRKQTARMLTALRQKEISDGIGPRESRKLKKRRLFARGMMIRHRKGNLNYKRLRARKWERFQTLPPDQTDVRTRLPGQQPGNAPNPRRPKRKRTQHGRPRGTKIDPDTMQDGKPLSETASAAVPPDAVPSEPTGGGITESEG